MKIIENKPDRLVIRRAPWALGSVLVVCILLGIKATLSSVAIDGWHNGSIRGLFYIGFPVLGFIVFIRRDELVMDRTRGLMELKHQTLFRTQRDEIPLDRFECATTQTHYPTSGNKTHRVALILSRTPKKEVRNLTPVYRAGSSADETAKFINAWFRAGEKR